VEFAFGDHCPSGRKTSQITLCASYARKDDDTFRKWVKQGLKESSFAVDGACNAKEAMQMASENLYGVILLDIGMPDLNGLWELQTLRQS
jgi:two-component system, OmpR family, response regulator VanR